MPLIGMISEARAGCQAAGFDFCGTTGRFCLKRTGLTTDTTRTDTAFQTSSECRRQSGLVGGGLGRNAMRRLFALAGLAIVLVANTGCFINMWSSDPNMRMEELLNESENLRQIQHEWRRFWMIDQPSHLTPVRVHGGIGP
jgi:hypothetical protein